MNKYLSIIGLTYFFMAFAVPPATNAPVAASRHLLQNRLHSDSIVQLQKAFLQAFEARDYDAAEQAIVSGARVTTAEQAEALLGWAQQNLNVRLSDVLVRQGVASMRNADGTTLFIKAIQDHDVKRIISFMRYPDGHLDTTDKEGNTPLLTALHEYGWHLAEVLIQCGAQVDVANKRGATPLHMASVGKDKSLELVREILKRGVDVNARTKKNRTPLMAAALVGYEPAIRLLLECGADCETNPDTTGFTFFDYVWLHDGLSDSVTDFIDERSRPHSLPGKLKKLLLLAREKFASRFF